MAGDEPYDYRRERIIASVVLTGLVVALVLPATFDRSYRIDIATLAELIGALLTVLGLGILARRRGGDA